MKLTKLLVLLSYLGVIETYRSLMAGEASAHIISTIEINFGLVSLR